jgi:phosphoribosylanthranilate isomerase
LPNVKIVQVLHESSIEEAIKLGTSVDFILFDSGNPNAAVKTSGGTPNIHNWEISKAIVDNAEVPVFLAGGLKKENVKEAIQFVGSFGLDLCSGVRVNGNLDEVKLTDFFEEVRNSSF